MHILVEGTGQGVYLDHLDYGGGPFLLKGCITPQKNLHLVEDIHL